MKKLFLKIHLWLALPLGLIVTVICLSGAVLVFRTEIEEALHPERYFMETHGRVETYGRASLLELEQLGVLVEAQLGEPVSGFSIPSDSTRNYIATPASNPRAAVYVNPYTGDVVQRTSGGSFFGTMQSLHRWLLHPAVGKPIVGYTTLLFVVILITGIVIIFPNSRKKWKRILTVHTRKGWRRFWYDLHISAGTWVAIILLALALTGLTWSFRWYNTAFYRVLGAEAPAARAVGTRLHLSPAGGGARRAGVDSPPPASGHPLGEGDTPPPPDRTHWDALLHKIKQENPKFKTITIRDGAISVAQRRTFGNSRAMDNYSFDAATGKITAHNPYAAQPRTNKIRGWIYSIHAGTWGGWFSKIITCLAALIGASLPLTGYYIFYKKRM